MQTKRLGPLESRLKKLSTVTKMISERDKLDWKDVEDPSIPSAFYWDQKNYILVRFDRRWRWSATALKFARDQRTQRDEAESSAEGSSPLSISTHFLIRAPSKKNKKQFCRWQDSPRPRLRPRSPQGTLAGPACSNGPRRTASTKYSTEGHVNLGRNSHR